MSGTCDMLDHQQSIAETLNSLNSSVVSTTFFDALQLMRQVTAIRAEQEKKGASYLQHGRTLRGYFKNCKPGPPVCHGSASSHLEPASARQDEQHTQAHPTVVTVVSLA